MLRKKLCHRIRYWVSNLAIKSHFFLCLLAALALLQGLSSPLGAMPFFGNKELTVKNQYIDKKSIKDLDLNLHIWFPKTKKPRPVMIFFTGMTGLITSKVYAGFIKQIAAKGISVISIHSSKNYPGQFKETASESHQAYAILKKELNTVLAKKHRGIANNLLDWDQTLLMGHSSGAQPLIAFYRLAMNDIKGIVLLDPVDGDPFGKTEKSIQENEVNSFDVPLLISSTEFCKQPGFNRQWFPACCPAGLSSEHFFKAFKGPKWYVNALDYAHVDLLDDNFAWLANKTRFCKPSEGADKILIKKFNAEMISDFVGGASSQNRSNFNYLDKEHQQIMIDVQKEI